MKTVLAVLLATGAFAAPNRLDWRIVGGGPAAEGQYPYQVSIKYTGSHNCGGSILNENIVLTAAHCVVGFPAEYTTIMAGANKLNADVKHYPVKKSVAHENYSSFNIQNDIALLILGSLLELSTLVSSIALETEQVGGEIECVLSGWGKVSFIGEIPNDLQTIQLKTLTNEKCKEEMRLGSPQIVDSQICTLTNFGQGACKGDSGGPLTANGKQIGIVSWGGWPCALGEPDVFTRVSSFIDWINSNQQ